MFLTGPLLILRTNIINSLLIKTSIIHQRRIFFINYNKNLIKVFSSMVKQGPRPLVICGPSGSGKSTLLKKLFKEFPETFGFSVSHTTRKPRPGEENAIHYHFVSFEDMQSAIERGEFLETAVFSGNMYGTSKKAVQNVQNHGKVCVLDIEIEGVKQIRNSDLNPILVFVMPPSMKELEQRLRGRNTETDESLQKRLNTAKTEIDYGSEPGNFHIVIHNHNLKKAYNELRDFIVKELETQRNEDDLLFNQATTINQELITTFKNNNSSSVTPLPSGSTPLIINGYNRYE